MRKAILFIPLFLLLAVGGCKTIDPATVEAAKATYDVVASEWQEYFEADENLDADAKERRKVLLREWKAWIRELSK